MTSDANVMSYDVSHVTSGATSPNGNFDFNYVTQNFFELERDQTLRVGTFLWALNLTHLPEQT